MFVNKSKAFYALQRISEATAHLKSIDTLPIVDIIFHKRFLATAGLSSAKPSTNITNKNPPKNEDKNFAHDTSGSENMPPKKLKLATKVKNLVSTRVVGANKRANLIIADVKSIRKSNPAQSNSAAGLNLVEAVSETSEIIESAITKSKLNLRSLRPRSSENDNEEAKPKKTSNKRTLRAVVDIEMMKSELKQLEDPPITPEEKLLSANRLGFEFFDVPCETLAQNLLGKILVRKLENGTILKGKIVETESYLGGDDKASQTYQNKVTPRNIPMYMPPGTIYVYLTYGMYHCFNVSSRAPGASVFIRALEPTIGHSYMELLRNTCLKRGSKEKEMTKKLRILKPHQLCNGPSKLCTALEIDKETFNERNITKCSDLWIENDKPENESPFAIVAAPRIGIESAGDGSVVLIRALAPIDGMEQMAAFRNTKPTGNSKARALRRFKDHELSNGPSKFCMAFSLNRDHSKYSMCSWRGMWIEDNDEKEDIKIIQCPRIGIDSAGPEWALKPLRFYILGEKSVSKIDKKAEAAADK